MAWQVATIGFAALLPSPLGVKTFPESEIRYLGTVVLVHWADTVIIMFSFIEERVETAVRLDLLGILFLWGTYRACAELSCDSCLWLQDYSINSM